MTLSITKRFINDLHRSSSRYHICTEDLAMIVLELTTNNKKIKEMIVINTRPALEDYKYKLEMTNSPIQRRLIKASMERLLYDASITCCNAYCNHMIDKFARWIFFIYSNPLLTKKTHERLSSFRTIPKYRLII
jgi:hypothetical protein